MIIRCLTLAALCALSLSLLPLTSCKKETPVDPRDQYLGTWAGTSNMKIPGYKEEMAVSAYVITKTANAANKITLTDPTDATNFKTAAVNGNTFTLESSNYTTDLVRDDGTIVKEAALANEPLTGTLSGSSLTISGIVSASVNNATAKGTWKESLVRK